MTSLYPTIPKAVDDYRLSIDGTAQKIDMLKGKPADQMIQEISYSL